MLADMTSSAPQHRRVHAGPRFTGSHESAAGWFTPRGASATLELIAGDAPLNAVLENLCDGIDTQDPQMMSTVLLMDLGGDQLSPAVGRRVPSGWTRAITPLPVTASTMALRTAKHSQIATGYLVWGASA
jgi:hypothetical protein